MRRVVLYVAASLDGYIARQDGSVDWLEPSADEVGKDEMMAGYTRFYETVDGLMMGRRTYDQVLGFGSWPYEGKPCIVFTNRSARPDPNVQFVSENPAKALTRLPQCKDGVIWLVGGANLAGQFASARLIDEYRITVIPAVLGSGISLFTREFPETRMRHVGTETIGGMVELRYVTR